VNPPAGIESDEIILATCGVSAAFGASATGASIVGICEGELMGCPQDLADRKWKPSYDQLAQNDAHLAISSAQIPSRLTKISIHQFPPNQQLGALGVLHKTWHAICISGNRGFRVQIGFGHACYIYK
jgi:hypothetical protein